MPAQCQQQVAGGMPSSSSTESDRRTDNADIDFVVVSAASEYCRKGIRSRWRSSSSTAHPRRPIPTRPSSVSSCRTAGSENPSQSPRLGPGSAASRRHFRDMVPLDRVAWGQNSRSLLGRGGSALWVSFASRTVYGSVTYEDILQSLTTRASPGMVCRIRGLRPNHHLILGGSQRHKEVGSCNQDSPGPKGRCHRSRDLACRTRGVTLYGRQWFLKARACFSRALFGSLINSAHLVRRLPLI